MVPAQTIAVVQSDNLTAIFSIVIRKRNMRAMHINESTKTMVTYEESQVLKVSHLHGNRNT